VVLAFVPDSTEVYLFNPGTGEEYSMGSAHDQHFFEVVLPGLEEIFMYQYRIVAMNGRERFVHHPYFFMPQMGELYLLSQLFHSITYFPDTPPETMNAIALELPISSGLTCFVGKIRTDPAKL
jgi:hypothetical protein